MDQPITYYECHHIGLQGTTAIVIRKSPEGYEARMGFALFGTTNMDEDGYRACGYNPYSEDFHDNYAKGTGATEEEALAAMRASLEQIHESLWI